MRFLLLAFAMSAGLAHADLYRWIDRETGSVKFSSYPPPWFGDPARESSAPAVEVIRDRAPAPARPAKPAAGRPEPATTAPGLEVQWRGLVRYFASEQASRDLDLSAVTFLQQVELYQTVSRELDRQDPAGAARRHAVAEKAGVADTLRKGLTGQLRTKPAPQ